MGRGVVSQRKCYLPFSTDPHLCDLSVLRQTPPLLWQLTCTFPLGYCYTHLLRALSGMEIQWGLCTNAFFKSKVALGVCMFSLLFSPFFLSFSFLNPPNPPLFFFFLRLHCLYYAFSPRILKETCYGRQLFNLYDVPLSGRENVHIT